MQETNIPKGKHLDQYGADGHCYVMCKICIYRGWCSCPEYSHLILTLNLPIEDQVHSFTNQIHSFFNTFAQ